jgi:hypothetical protein
MKHFAICLVLRIINEPTAAIAYGLDKVWRHRCFGSLAGEETMVRGGSGRAIEMVPRERRRPHKLCRCSAEASMVWRGSGDDLIDWVYSRVGKR